MNSRVNQSVEFRPTRPSRPVDLPVANNPEVRRIENRVAALRPRAPLNAQRDRSERPIFTPRYLPHDSPFSAWTGDDITDFEVCHPRQLTDAHRLFVFLGRQSNETATGSPDDSVET